MGRFSLTADRVPLCCENRFQGPRSWRTVDNCPMGIESEVQKLVREELGRAIERLRRGSESEGKIATCLVCGHDGARHDASAFVPGYEPAWTTAQVAAFLGLKPRTILNILSAKTAGFPKPRKNGKLHAFVPSEVAEYRRARLGF